jgi:hypothetical protein
MAEIIALIIFFGSLLGIGIILYKKAPRLSSFTYIETSSNMGIIGRIREKIKNGVSEKTATSRERITLKMLSKTRVLFMKMEHRIACLLNSMRQKSIEKSIEKKKCFSDNYWEKIKTKRRIRKQASAEESDKSDFN